MRELGIAIRLEAMYCSRKPAPLGCDNSLMYYSRGVYMDILRTFGDWQKRPALDEPGRTLYLDSAGLPIFSWPPREVTA